MSIKESILKLLKRPYLFWSVTIFIFYMLINLLLSGFYDTIPLIIIYAKTINWISLGSSLLLSLSTGILVSMTMVLTYIKYKERKQCKEGVILSGTGSFGGLIAGICPLCVTGIFPLILASLGISFSFASLPFQGLEIQMGVVLILITSLYLLTK